MSVFRVAGNIFRECYSAIFIFSILMKTSLWERTDSLKSLFFSYRVDSKSERELQKLFPVEKLVDITLN